MLKSHSSKNKLKEVGEYFVFYINLLFITGLIYCRNYYILTFLSMKGANPVAVTIHSLKGTMSVALKTEIFPHTTNLFTKFLFIYYMSKRYSKSQKSLA